MIKQFFNSSHARFAKQQSNVTFQEVSNGIYRVSKDRFDKYLEYATTTEVIDALNYVGGVAVLHSNGSSGYSNFEFELKG